MTITVKTQISAFPLQLREQYYNHFIVSDTYKKDLSIYKMLKWSAKYFLEQWESNIGTYAAGTIRRYNHIFHVCLCSSISIGWIKEKVKENPDYQLVLSFRKIDGLPAMVLVDSAMIQNLIGNN